jgi:magnesium transporter
MLTVFSPRGTCLERATVESGEALPDGAVWLDLNRPSADEDSTVADALGVELPTREEMQEIEISSRLYIENGARFMTAMLMSHSETPTPKATPVTFVLAGHRLATVRYDEPRPFTIVSHKLARSCPPHITGEIVLMELLDAIIDRAADILERIGAEIDHLSHTVLEPAAGAWPISHHEVLKELGRKGDLTSKVRESLVSVGRLVLFLANESEGLKWTKDKRAQLKSMQRDVSSLTDHASYITNKVTFLLDAMLGVVNIQQNNIIKIFSVAAVVLMPPTLIASIYGMNFKHMPELAEPYAYPVTLVAMVIAAVLPYMYFKWKKWL